MDKHALQKLHHATQWFQALLARGTTKLIVASSTAAIIHLDRFLASRRPEVTVDTLTVADLEAWQASLRKLPPSRANAFVQAVRAFFAWLVSQHLLPASPAATLRTTPRRLPAPPRNTTLLRLIKSVTGASATALRDRALLEVLYWAGPRIGEVIHMDVQHVDLDRSRVLFRSGHEVVRALPLPPSAVEAVRQYLLHGRPALVGADTDALWIGNRGSRIDVSAVCAIVTKVSKKLRVTVTAHDFRVAFVTRTLARGCSLADVAVKLGHSNAAISAKYIPRPDPS